MRDIFESTTELTGELKLRTKKATKKNLLELSQDKIIEQLKGRLEVFKAWKKHMEFYITKDRNRFITYINLKEIIKEIEECLK